MEQRLPDNAKPKVSIILLNLNSYRDTRDCLESLQRVQYPDFEVILVDNGSTDGSGARLQREFPHVQLLESKENLGFAGGNNLGIESALQHGSAYVLLLNNDTIVEPTFLGHLVDVGENDARIGILGAKIFYASEPQRIWYAGGEVIYGIGMCRHRGQGQLDEGNRFSRVENTQFVTGCAMMIKAKVFQSVGLLDARLFVYWEDADFCMRAGRAGYRCAFVPMAQVWHKISTTCGAESSFTRYLFTRNHLIWVARYVPLPYKPGALFFTLAKKVGKALLLALDGRELARPVWAGIWAFFLRVYGAPKKDLPKRTSLLPIGH
jgi:GT2 family glycosyltransferase